MYQVGPVRVPARGRGARLHPAARAWQGARARAPGQELRLLLFAMLVYLAVLLGFGDAFYASSGVILWFIGGQVLAFDYRRRAAQTVRLTRLLHLPRTRPASPGVEPAGSDRRIRWTRGTSDRRSPRWSASSRSTGLTVYATFDTEELPSYGEDVVVLLIGDEWARAPAYLPRVRVVFRNLCSRPNLGCRPLAWPSPATLSSLLPAGRAALRSAPGPLAPSAGQARRPAQVELPIGTFNLLDLPVKPFAERGSDMFFAGQRGPCAGPRRRCVKARVMPKDLSRRAMLRNVERLRERTGVAVDVRITDSFQQSAAADPGEYSRALMDSRLALVPRGATTETHRFFQALKYGCVVVTDAVPPMWFYEGAPIVRLRHWDELERRRGPAAGQRPSGWRPCTASRCGGGGPPARRRRWAGSWPPRSTRSAEHGLLVDLARAGRPRGARRSAPPPPAGCASPMARRRAGSASSSLSAAASAGGVARRHLAAAVVGNEVAQPAGVGGHHGPGAGHRLHGGERDTGRRRRAGSRGRRPAWPRGRRRGRPGPEQLDPRELGRARHAGGARPRTPGRLRPPRSRAPGSAGATLRERVQQHVDALADLEVGQEQHHLAGLAGRRPAPRPAFVHPQGELVHLRSLPADGSSFGAAAGVESRTVGGPALLGGPQRALEPQRARASRHRRRPRRTAASRARMGRAPAALVTPASGQAHAHLDRGELVHEIEAPGGVELPVQAPHACAETQTRQRLRSRRCRGGGRGRSRAPRLPARPARPRRAAHGRGRPARE